jgi:hypothetical protein
LLILAAAALVPGAAVKIMCFVLVQVAGIVTVSSASNRNGCVKCSATPLALAAGTFPSYTCGPWPVAFYKADRET